MLGRGMEWGEAIRHVRTLRTDPSSQLAASLEGWDFPLERIGWTLAHLSDVLEAAHLKKPSGYDPRPLKPKDNRKKWGDVGDRTRAEVVAILNARGHNLPV